MSWYLHWPSFFLQYVLLCFLASIFLALKDRCSFKVFTHDQLWSNTIHAASEFHIFSPLIILYLVVISTCAVCKDCDHCGIHQKLDLFYCAFLHLAKTLTASNFIFPRCFPEVYQKLTISASFHIIRGNIYSCFLYFILYVVCRDCGHHGVCQNSRIMYAWAKNAPTTSLPQGVGFRIGGQTGIRFLTLQIHYAKALPEGVKDHSGLQMELTTQK